MVSIEFLQGINMKSLARHQNGTIKHFKSETEHQKSKTLTYEFLKTQIKSKREISKLQWKVKRCCDI